MKPNHDWFIGYKTGRPSSAYSYSTDEQESISRCFGWQRRRATKSEKDKILIRNAMLSEGFTRV